MERVLQTECERRLLHGQAWEKHLHMTQERRRRERLVLGVVAGAGQHDSFAGARARDVAEVAFEADLLALVEPQLQPGGSQRDSVVLVEQDGAAGRRGEHGLVQAQDENLPEIGIAGPVNGADQDLVQAGRNNTDGETAETGIDHGQPICQRDGGGVESNLEVAQPGLQFLARGVVNLGLHHELRGAGGDFAPGFESHGDAQVVPELAQSGC